MESLEYIIDVHNVHVDAIKCTGSFVWFVDIQES